MRTIHAPLYGFVMACLTSGATALATTEPPPAYDARSVGMGSTGVAHVHNGASLFYNPASMQGVEHGAATIDIAPLAPQVTAPLAGNDTDVKSSRAVFPMFLVGGAYRVSPRLTLGLAAFPTMGFGAKYSSVPMLGGALLKAQLSAIEIAPGAAFAITDNISVGATYRVTYMAYGMESPIMAPPPAPAGTLLPTKTDVSGWSFLGVQLGVFARATKTTRLGLTYRNKVPVNMSGTTEMAGQSLHTEIEFASPHTFKLGIAQSFLDERLLIACDVRLSLYHEANKDLAVKTDIPGAGTQTSSQRLDWSNTVGVYAGAEYRFLPSGMAARVGYSVAQSATPTRYAQPILPTPGLQQAIHLGAGVALGKVDIDVGGYYLFGGKDAQPENGNPSGEYRLNALLGALSGSYRW